MKPEILPPVTQQDKTEAHKLHQQILALITETRSAESELEHNYVSLAKAIYKVQTKLLWQVLGYNSWKEYFSFLEEKFGKGRTQLYGYIGTVRALQEHVEDKDMVDMGISRASELKKAVQATGKSPSDDLIKHALDKKLTLPEFREKVHQDFGIVDHNEKGTWYDLGGLYLTTDERETFEKAIKFTKGVDPPIDHMLSKHQQFKEVLFRWLEEFMGTYESYQSKIDAFNEIHQSANQESPFD